MSTDGQPRTPHGGWRWLTLKFYLGVVLLIIVGSRAQGNTKEGRTRPAPRKAQCKRKVQSFDQTLMKCRRILIDAAEGRVIKGVGDKRIVLSWTGVELDRALKDGHLVHSVRELAHMTPAAIRRLCVRELVKDGALIRVSHQGRVHYKLASTSEVLAQAS